MMKTAVEELTDLCNKLDRPSDLELKIGSEKKKQSQRKRRMEITESKLNLDEVDMESDEEEKTGKMGRTMDIDDEAVKDRWSRYIGAMGIEAVNK